MTSQYLLFDTNLFDNGVIQRAIDRCPKCQQPQPALLSVVVLEDNTFALSLVSKHKYLTHILYLLSPKGAILDLLGTKSNTHDKISK